MTKTTFRERIRPGFVALALFCAAPLLAGPVEDQAEHVIRLFLAGRFEAVAARNDAPGIQRFQRRLRSTLQVRTIEVERIELEQLAVAGSAATIEARITVRKRERRDVNPWTATEVMRLRLRLREESGGWRLDEIEYPDNELADRLIALGAEQRSALLEQNPGRVTQNVVRILCSRAQAMTERKLEWDKALATASLARTLAVQIGDGGGEALAVGVHSVLARLRGDFPAAERLARESLVLAQAAGDPDVLARAWFDLAVLVERQRNYSMGESTRRNSEQHFAEMLRFAERGEDRSLFARGLFRRAERAMERGDFFSARHSFEQMRQVAEESEDQLQLRRYRAGLAQLYYHQSDYDLAAHHFEAVLKATPVSNVAMRAIAALWLGFSLNEAGRYDAARVEFERLLALDKASLVLDSGGPNSVAVFQAQVIEGLAYIAVREGKLDEAECLYQQAFDLAGGIANNAYDLVPYLVKAGRPGAALGVALRRTEDVPEVQLVDTLSAAAKAYRALGDRQRALDIALEAIGLREELHERTSGGHSQRVRSAERSGDCYELAAELALDLGDSLQALTYLEQGRGRLQAEILAGRRSDVEAELDEKDQQRKREQEQVLARIRSDLDRAEGANRKTSAVALKQELRAAQRTYETFLDGLQARAGRRSLPHKRIDRAAMEETLQRLPSDLAVIEYLVTDDHLHLFVIRKDPSGVPRLKHRAIRLEREQLDRQTRSLAALLAQRSMRFRTAAAEMYRLLITPVESDLNGVQSLLIVRDDVLWQVPFAALIDGRGRFFVERAAIAYAASISVYVSMSDHATRPKDRSVGLLAVANPTLDSTFKDAFTLSFGDRRLPPLPEAELEADVLRTLYGKANSIVLKGSNATETRTKAAAGGAAVLHIATHGLLDDRNPMYSRLALARDKTTTDDGWLEAWEIARLDIRADLVVLSACETARGRVGGGEGVIGMAWSFFLAGARSTVATEWKVETQSTSQFMISFHRELRHERSRFRKARALRRAQLEFLRSEIYSHPFYWAPFVLIGDAS